MTLSQYYFEIEFIPGHKNSFADMLSREFLEKNSVHSLSCDFIRRIGDYVEIETTHGWVRYNKISNTSLSDHDDDWYPVKEIRWREGIPNLWTWDDQEVDYLVHIGNISYEIYYEEDNRIGNCRLTIRQFNNPFRRTDFDPERQKYAFFQMMNLENISSNFFYHLQFDFSYEDWPTKRMNQEDPFPNWFGGWWKLYGLNAILTMPYQFTRLKIDGFSAPGTLHTRVLYKSLKDLIEIEDIAFLNAIRRCGHTYWFVAQRICARQLVSSTDGTRMEYNDFHQQSDPDNNPFEEINFLLPPEDHENKIWESEKEVTIQFFSTHLT